MVRFAAWSALPLAIAFAASPASAQSIHVSPMAGAFHPSSDAFDLGQAADQGRLVKGNALALGLNLELSLLRLSAVYATGADIAGGGLGGSNDIGDGSLLAVAGDVVLRPLPRIWFQPYVLGGVGLKRQSFSFEDQSLDEAFDEATTDFAWHAGVGADLMLGNFGIVAEVTDFITSGENDRFGRHDTFLMMGVRLRL